MRKRTFIQICSLLCVLFLLCGCRQKTIDPLDSVKSWLAQDFCFRVSYSFRDFRKEGISDEINVVYAADGSHSTIYSRNTWNYQRNLHWEETSEFYCRYEDSPLVCYRYIDDVDGVSVERTVMTSQDIERQTERKLYWVDVSAIVPDYLQNLSVTHTKTSAILTYELPLKKVDSDSTILAVFINYAAGCSAEQYEPSNTLTIGCTLETNPITYQPKSLTFDFTQLKPMLLSTDEGSADEELMTMTVAFDYSLPDSITPPDYAIP